MVFNLADPDTPITTEVYHMFVNALSFTVALASIETYSKQHTSNLIMLCFMLVVGITLLQTIEGIITRWSKQQRARSSYASWLAPAWLIIYLLQTTTRVLVHFLSTAFGQWIINLSPGGVTGFDEHVGATAATILFGLSLMWLVGFSMGVVRPP
jgi:hypothetical protein